MYVAKGRNGAGCQKDNYEGSHHEEKIRLRKETGNPFEAARVRGEEPAVGFRKECSVGADVSTECFHAPPVRDDWHNDKAHENAQEHRYDWGSRVESLEGMGPGIEDAVQLQSSRSTGKSRMREKWHAERTSSLTRRVGYLTTLTITRLPIIASMTKRLDQKIAFAMLRGLWPKSGLSSKTIFANLVVKVTKKMNQRKNLLKRLSFAMIHPAGVPEHTVVEIVAVCMV